MGLIYTFTILLVATAAIHALFQGQRFPHTHNKQALNSAYNQRVQSLQEYRRPLDMKPIFGVDVAKYLDKIHINHRGQVATLEDGQRFLVHKGPNFGHASQTVAVDAKVMSNNWKPYGSAISSGSKPVGLGDLVKAGGKNYDTVLNNCMHGACYIKDRFQSGKRR